MKTVIYGGSTEKEGADWLVRRAKIQKDEFIMKGRNELGETQVAERAARVGSRK